MPRIPTRRNQLGEGQVLPIVSGDLQLRNASSPVGVDDLAIHEGAAAAEETEITTG